jgi:rare lipoprotein A
MNVNAKARACGPALVVAAVGTLFLGACATMDPWLGPSQSTVGWRPERGLERLASEPARLATEPVRLAAESPRFVAERFLPLPSKMHFPAALAGALRSSASSPPADATPPTLEAPAAEAFGPPERGIASWYSEQWAWKKTANGEIYNPYSFTAAHKTLPFGSMVRVKNRKNGRVLAVRINNRGPFVKGRIIDVSPAVAKGLGFYEDGLVPVEIVRIR